MIQRLFLSVLIGLAAITAQGANVLFSFGNPTNGLPYLSEVTLTPVTNGIPSVVGSVIAVNETLRFKTDTNGQLTVTNVYPLTYRVHFALAGKNTTTDFQISLTNALSDPATIAASGIITVPTNSSAPGSTALSLASAGVLFYPRTSNPSNYINFNQSSVSSTAYFTNTPNLGFPVYALALTAGQSYYISLPADGSEFIADESFDVAITSSGYFTAPAGDPIYVLSGDTAIGDVGSNVATRVYLGTPTNLIAATVLGSLEAANNLSDLSDLSTARNNLFGSASSARIQVRMTNAIVRIGDPSLMAEGDNLGTPQLTVYANSHPIYRGTNVLGTSTENVLEIVNGDRTGAAYIGFSTGLTNEGSSVSTTSGFQHFQIGLGGDLYNRRLTLPGSNYCYVGFITLDPPVDFALSTTASPNRGTNPVWTAWYYDNTANKTWFSKSTGGPSPRDPNYKGALLINHTTGDVTATNGTTTVSNLIATGTISGNGSGLTSIPAANLTGTLPAISGANLTGIVATDATKVATNGGTGFNLINSGTFTAISTGTNEFTIQRGGTATAGTNAAARFVYNANGPLPTITVTVTNQSTWKSAGTSPTMYLTNSAVLNDSSMVLVIIPGGTVTASTNICTITFGTPAPNNKLPNVTISPANGAGAGTIKVVEDFQQRTTNGFTLASGSSALITGTLYFYSIHVDFGQ